MEWKQALESFQPHEQEMLGLYLGSPVVGEYLERLKQEYLRGLANLPISDPMTGITADQIVQINEINMTLRGIHLMTILNRELNNERTKQ